ncbi:hypothetical protein LCGC14_1467400 [marine sediment metagenome]|uniref:TFIIB-type domain-containing protein n=1 Tax=marine sediment metagenome TaxID=412755 RepID=A0A0F9LTZ1_9ZZZZ
MTKPQCPECGKTGMLLHRQRDDTLYCRNCGHRWPRPKDKPRKGE